MNQSSIYSRLLIAISAAVAMLAILAPIASAEEPAEGYKQFVGCPSPKTENSKVVTCFRTEVTGGHFQMGSKNVPIEKPLEISGGYNAAGTEFTFTSKGGMPPSPQKVPGGVVGLTGLEFLLGLFSVEALSLYATTELVGIPGSPLKNPLTLPIKVHLTNPAGLLGNNCYVGTSTEPIKLNLTTLTTSPPPPNEPITGVPPKVGNGSAPGILKGTGATFVDNSFAAPSSSGCKLILLGFIPLDLTSLVNSQSGLPSPAGTNETVQEANFELVSAKKAYP